MAIISKKTFIITGVVIFGACTAVVGYAIGHSGNSSVKPVAVSEVNDNVSALERATKPPKGAVSPTIIAKNIGDYIDKEVTVYGLVTKVSSTTYLVVGQEAKDPGGLPVDFSKANIDPSKYANTPPANTGNPPTLKPAVTITGTMKRTDKSITLIVSSAEE